MATSPKLVERLTAVLLERRSDGTFVHSTDALLDAVPLVALGIWSGLPDESSASRSRELELLLPVALERMGIDRSAGLKATLEGLDRYYARHPLDKALLASLTEAMGTPSPPALLGNESSSAF